VLTSHPRMRARHRLRSHLLVTLAAVIYSAAAGGQEPPSSPTSPGDAKGDPDTNAGAAGDHPARIASYTMKASLDPVAHTIHGEATIAWTNASRKSVNELWFHLYLNAFKNQSSVFMRAPIGGFRGSTVPAAWGTIDMKKLVWVDGEERHDLLAKMELKRPNDDDETDARIPLPHEVVSGESITLEVEWNDKLPSIVERTGYDGSFHMVGQWFPKIAKIEPDGTFAHFPFHHLGEFYADFGSYDVTIDAPQDYVLGATGPMVESHVENGRRFERHVQDDVHDFAFTAWDKFQERKETIDDVDVRILYPPNYDDIAERELSTMRFAIPHYGKRYGKYPYKVLTLMHPPTYADEAGGMEYPTFITTGHGPAWLPRGIHFPEGVTIHEFGHQYFYGLLASNEVKWPFLDEGLNQYAEGEAMAAWKGAGSGVDFIGISVGDAEAQAERARHFEHDAKVATPAWSYATGNQYGALVYSRTAAILETMARVYGASKMDRALGTYARRFRFRHPTPSDLEDVVKEEIGPFAAAQLHIALFEKGWIDFAVTQTSSHVAREPAGLFDRGGTRETVPNDKVTKGHWQGWVLVTRRGSLEFPVDVELISADGTRTRVTWDGDGESTRIPYSGSSPLRSVIVDPENRVLLDDHPDNNFATTVAESQAGAPRTLERATFWAEMLLGGIGP
jgi:hypothetical protein